MSCENVDTTGEGNVETSNSIASVSMAKVKDGLGGDQIVDVPVWCKNKALFVAEGGHNWKTVCSGNAADNVWGEVQKEDNRSGFDSIGWQSAWQHGGHPETENKT